MPSIVKRGDSYRIFVSLGTDGTGKAIRKSTTFHPPKGVHEKKRRYLAECYAYRFEAQCKAGNELCGESRFRDLYEWYFQRIAPLVLKEHTLMNEKNLIADYVLPRLGEMKLEEITPYRIDGMLFELLSKGKMKGTGGLSAGTVNLIRAILCGMFETAVKKKVTSENPVKLSARLRPEEKERRFIDVNECRRMVELLPKMKNKQVMRAVKLLLFTGMRRGELLALHWEDVDFENSEIHIRYTLFRKDGKAVLTSPKTKTSVRTVPVPEEIRKELREQQQYVSHLREKNRENWKETGACFVNLHGDYLNGEYVNGVFREFLSENGFPPYHLHDLRHANASLLINTGVPMKIVSEHLGHESTRTTEEFYTHLFRDAKRITADAISEVLR